jgi:hypothetical protein
MSAPDPGKLVAIGDTSDPSKIGVVLAVLTMTVAGPLAVQGAGAFAYWAWHAAVETGSAAFWATRAAGPTAGAGELCRRHCDSATAVLEGLAGLPGCSLTRCGSLGPATGPVRDVPQRAESSAASAFAQGRAFEAQQLRDLGEPANTQVFRPTADQLASSAFRVIVGTPKYTPTGRPVGTIIDAASGVELKHGASVLSSSYQLRLQTYRSLVLLEMPYTIRTTRPVNASFAGWLNRWGVTLEHVR